MGITIRELRPEDINKALAFAAAQGRQVDPKRVATAQSVLAWDGDELMGVLLSVHAADGGHAMELAVAESAEDGLAKRLLDTALLKMRSLRVGKSRVRLAGKPEDALALWSATNWTPDAIDGAPERSAALDNAADDLAA